VAQLRPVADDERAQPAKPLSVTKAAKTGDRRKLLVSLRDRVALTVEDPNCPPRDLAALSRRLQELSREIAVIDEASEQNPVGEAAKTPDVDWEAI
jgi:hypothetical protein